MIHKLDVGRFGQRNTRINLSALKRFRLTSSSECGLIQVRKDLVYSRFSDSSCVILSFKSLHIKLMVLGFGKF